jgi:hypothetical protein
MKYQIVISGQTNYLWRKCKTVTLKDGVVEWELGSSYDLYEAYAKEPHRQLVNATDDASLKTFIKDWGPLRDVLPSESRGNDPIEHFRLLRDQLTWKADLLVSIERPERRRGVLERFDQVQKAQGEIIANLDRNTKERLVMRALSGALESVFTGVVDQDLVILSNVPPWDKENALLDESIPDTWLKTATADAIEEICSKLVKHLKFSHQPTYQVVQSRGSTLLRAAAKVSSLWDALDWMLWQDIYHERPFLRCEECDHLITITTKHPKRFCSDICARRKTTRLWHQRKREKARAANGSKKTR